MARLSLLQCDLGAEPGRVPESAGGGGGWIPAGAQLSVSQMDEPRARRPLVSKNPHLTLRQVQGRLFPGKIRARFLFAQEARNPVWVSPILFGLFSEMFT